MNETPDGVPVKPTNKALGHGVAIVDMAKAGLSRTFGHEAVPLIAFGLSAEIIGCIAVDSVPQEKRKSVRRALALLKEMFGECAQAHHDKQDKLIVLAPAGTEVDRNETL